MSLISYCKSLFQSFDKVYVELGHQDRDYEGIDGVCEARHDYFNQPLWQRALSDSRHPLTQTRLLVKLLELAAFLIVFVVVPAIGAIVAACRRAAEFSNTGAGMTIIPIAFALLLLVAFAVFVTKATGRPHEAAKPAEAAQAQRDDTRPEPTPVPEREAPDLTAPGVSVEASAASSDGRTPSQWRAEGDIREADGEMPAAFRAWRHALAGYGAQYKAHGDLSAREWCEVAELKLFLGQTAKALDAMRNARRVDPTVEFPHTLSDLKL